MVDLHMHSSYSDDGEYSPQELVRKCFDAGIRVMSVTDHNCVRAMRRRRRPPGQKISVISRVSR